MSLIVSDRVVETSTSTGTGALALAGAVTGYQRFSAKMAVGDTCYYTIEGINGSGTPTGEWETGLGTYSATNTLTRTTVKDSSNAGAAVTFSAGTKRVFLNLIASANSIPWYWNPPTVATFNTTLTTTSTFSDADDTDVGYRLSSNVTYSGPRGRCKAITTPTADWQVTIRFEPFGLSGGACNVGISVVKSDKSKVTCWGWDNRHILHRVRFNTTGYDGSETNLGLADQFPNWLRVRYVASAGVLHYDASQNGKDWMTDIATEGVDAYFGSRPSFVGLFLNTESNPYNHFGATFQYFNTNAF